MIIGIEGFMGDGKTIYMVRCLHNDFISGRKLFTNLKLLKSKYEIFDVQKFLDSEENEQLHNSTIGIDEITVFMDCRRSSKKENVALSYLILQSRKRDLDIYYTTQSFDLCDIRLIQYTSIFCIAQRCYQDIGSGKIQEIENMRNYTIIDGRKRKDNVTRFNMDISKYFNYYDTNQIITPLWNTNKSKVKDVKQ